MPRPSGPSFIATAYGPPWGGIQGSGITATGINLRNAPHRYIIAVDPTVIPLHSQVKVWPNPFGFTGTFSAEDTGGAIKGNHVDIYDWRGRADQLRWGRRQVSIEIVRSASAHPSSVYRTFGQSSGITRVDDGIDMTMMEGLGALGRGRVLWRDDTQWHPWGPFMSLSLEEGPRKGWHYYIAEGILPVRHIGDHVNTGDVIAQRAFNGGNGIDGNIEAGWAGFHNPRLTLAQERGHSGMVPSPEGEDFKAFYLGLPSGDAGSNSPGLLLNTSDLGRTIDQYDWSGEIYAAIIDINNEADTGYRYSQQARREILRINTFTTTGGQ